MATKKYDIHNPTQARRVIYDGIQGRMLQVTIEAGETKMGVEVDDAVAAEMQERIKNDGEVKTDLIFKPASGKAAGPSASDDTRSPARVKADKLIESADEVEFAQFKRDAHDLLGDRWPGGNPSKEVVLDLLEKVK